LHGAWSHEIVEGLAVRGGRDLAMQIQLIHPPVYVNPAALTALRPAPPLGLAYVAAALRKAGHEVSLIDAVAAAPTQMTREGRVMRLGLTNEQIVARIDPGAQALGITNMWSFSWPAVRSMIHEIRARFPDKIIVCGGEHFTGLAEHSMRSAPIDYIVLGEGEDIAVELFARLEQPESFDPASLRGICWRSGDAIVLNPRAERSRAVDDIPWPAWDLFDIAAYDENNFLSGIKFGKTMPILATRGCPYQCTYCSSPRMWTTRWYARNPVDVADEIESYVERYGARNFPFQDLTAIVRREWVIEFCREIIRRELDITWQLPTGTRCEVIDAEVAALLAQSGGRSMSYAPESGSDRTRKLIKKKMTESSLLRATDAAVGAGLNISCLLVIGFPHDTEEDLRETVRLVRTLARKGVDDIACAFFFPIPATELYDQLIEKKRIRLDDDLLMTPIFVHDRSLSEDRNYCENISAARLTAIKYWIVANFYLTSFVTHPGRPLRLLRNLIQGREASKMDTFLNEMRRKVVRALRGSRSRQERERALG
jgi:anaerobic magnesium-protoporphyrin IX monomethyl ester cyclase